MKWWGVKSTNSCEVIAKILKFLGWEYIQRALGGVENGEFEVKVNFDIENILKEKKKIWQYSQFSSLRILSMYFGGSGGRGYETVAIY